MLDGIVTILTKIREFLRETAVSFGGHSVSLWAVFVSGAAARVIWAVLFPVKEDGDDR